MAPRGSRLLLLLLLASSLGKQRQGGLQPVRILQRGGSGTTAEGVGEQMDHRPHKHQEEQQQQDVSMTQTLEDPQHTLLTDFDGVRHHPLFVSLFCQTHFAMSITRLVCLKHCCRDSRVLLVSRMVMCSR